MQAFDYTINWGFCWNLQRSVEPAFGTVLPAGLAPEVRCAWSFSFRGYGGWGDRHRHKEVFLTAASSSQFRKQHSGCQSVYRHLAVVTCQSLDLSHSKIHIRGLVIVSTEHWLLYCFFFFAFFFFLLGAIVSSRKV